MYFNGSLKGGLKYTRATQEEDALEGYVDADYAGQCKYKNIFNRFCVYSLWHNYKLEGKSIIREASIYNSSGVHCSC